MKMGIRYFKIAAILATAHLFILLSLVRCGTQSSLNWLAGEAWEWTTGRLVAVAMIQELTYPFRLLPFEWQVHSPGGSLLLVANSILWGLTIGAVVLVPSMLQRAGRTDNQQIQPIAEKPGSG